MVSIDNVYYSEKTEQIHITLFNDDPGTDQYVDIIENIYLYKIIADSEYQFDCSGTYNTTVFDSNHQAHIIIPIASIPDSGDKKFSISGTTLVSVKTSLGDLERTIWDTTEFYEYKMAIIESEGGQSGSIRSAKKIARFSFYEQMLLTAAKQGFSRDAAIYHAELLRMSSYGIPTVKQEPCYL